MTAGDVRLVITRGLPGSGKTTWARQLVATSGGRFARVNRDDVRREVFGAGGRTVLDHASEQVVTAVQHAMVRALLAAGRSVVVDDTNLRLRHARAWADLAVQAGAGFEVHDVDVPLELALERDAHRPDGVGVAVIRQLHDRFLAGGRALPPVEPTPVVAPAVLPYVPPDGGEPAWIVDIDGTVALMNGRGPFEWHRVGEDLPNEPVLQLVRGLAAAPFRIVMTSGRDAVCRPQTQEWLARYGVPYDELHMRPAGDQRKDSIVKAELFDRHVRERYVVHGVIDDRRQVVEMWRAMGLTVAQVAPGDF